MKYTIRKLVFLLVLAALIATPFGILEYKSRNTTDPYILMARAIEDFELGGVDVLNVKDHPNLENGLTLLAYIEDFPNWSIRKDRHNFMVYVTQIARDYEYDAAVIVVGWDYPPDQFRAQGAWTCLELRASACEWDTIPGQVMSQDFIKWPGIGNP